MDDERPALIPEGFERAHSRGPFSQINGPFWRKRANDGALSFGFVPEDRHCNSFGFVHGGMISTFFDSSMAHTVFDRFRCRLVTKELRVQFRSAVFRGRWCEVAHEIRSVEDNVVDIRGELLSRGGVAAVGEALFRIYPKD